MSGVKEHTVTVDPDAVKRAEEERQRRAEEARQRRAECARIQAEMKALYTRAVAQHQQTVAQITPWLHELQGMRTQTQAQSEQLRQLTAIVTTSAQHVEELGVTLSQDLSQAQQQATKARESARKYADALNNIQKGVSQQMAAALKSMERQHTEMLDATQRMAQLGDKLAEQDKAAHQLELKLSLLDRDPALLPATLMTLTAMERNNYTLIEMQSREGLIAYFEAENKRHVIAVRHQPVFQSQFEAQWEMVAEAFYLEGEECLEVMEDFIAEAKATGLGRMKYKSHTFPKKADQGVKLPLPIRKPVPMGSTVAGVKLPLPIRKPVPKEDEGETKIDKTKTRGARLKPQRSDLHKT